MADLDPGRPVDDQHMDAPIQEPTADEWRHAELVTAAHARDTDECRTFLQMLGAAPYRAKTVRKGRNEKSKPITREPRTL